MQKFSGIATVLSSIRTKFQVTNPGHNHSCLEASSPLPRRERIKVRVGFFATLGGTKFTCSFRTVVLIYKVSENKSVALTSSLLFILSVVKNPRVLPLRYRTESA